MLVANISHGKIKPIAKSNVKSSCLTAEDYLLEVE